MTNARKFIETFGIEPDLSTMVLECPLGEKEKCIWENNNVCHCIDWWIAEYQEPRKGHWIEKPHVYGVVFCSECGFELRIDNTNYCPNCGVKMAETEA